MQSLQQATHARNSDNPVISIRVRLGDTEHNIRGREGWALHALIERGKSGVTPFDWVGPRWSDYVLKLRRRGFFIESINEKHAGAFAGRHGRYILRSIPSVLQITRQHGGQR